METQEELIVRNSRPAHLLFALFCSGWLFWFVIGTDEKSKSLFETNLFLAILLTSLFLAATIYCWYKFFDQRPQLILNKQGIWHPKYGLIPWDNIWYIHSKSDRSDEFNGTTMYLKVKEEEKAIGISTTLMNVDSTQIRNFIQQYKGNNVIFDLGHEQR